MKYLLGSIMLLCLTSAFSQTREKLIAEGFVEMSQAMVDGNYSRAADYISEEFFDVVPKEQFVSLLEMMMNNPQMEVKLTLPEITAIGEVMEVDKLFYVILETKSVQKIRFFDANGNVAKLADSQIVQQTQAAWKEQLGEENFSYDEDSGFFTLNVSPKALAISSDGKTSWKYLTVDESSKEMIKSIIPAQVMSRL